MPASSSNTFHVTPSLPLLCFASPHYPPPVHNATSYITVVSDGSRRTLLFTYTLLTLQSHVLQLVYTGESEDGSEHKGPQGLDDLYDQQVHTYR